MNSAAKEHFHLDSQAVWLLALLGVILLVAGHVWRNRPFDKEVRRSRNGIAAGVMLLGLAMLPGSYMLFRYVDGLADARDVRVQAILADSPVKFKGFEVPEDTEQVRVETLVGKGTFKPCRKGKEACVPCEASFSVAGQNGQEWPLNRDSGSRPSKSCDLADTDEDGRYSEGSQKFYLNQIFVDPYRHRK